VHHAIAASNQCLSVRLPACFFSSRFNFAFAIKLNKRALLQPQVTAITSYQSCGSRPHRSVSAARLGGVANATSPPIQVTKMIRRKSLILRLLGIVTWTMTLAMLLTVMLRSRSSQGERKGN
jgi:hypothetical protein